MKVVTMGYGKALPGTTLCDRRIISCTTSGTPGVHFPGGDCGLLLTIVFRQGPIAVSKDVAEYQGFVLCAGG